MYKSSTSLKETPTLTAIPLPKKIIAIAASTFLMGAITSGLFRSPARAQANYPLLSVGSTGEIVSQLQATLKLMGFYQGAIDGTYSEPTLNAVAQFQTAAGIAADGITASTWQKLLPAASDITTIAAPPPIPTAVTPPPSEVATSPVPLGPPILSLEVSGSAVSQLQKELQELGYYNGPIDGGFGAQTLAAVEQFQRDQGLVVDGIVGSSTWDALSQALNN